MHSFLWSGRDAQGEQRSERVSAENAQAAKAILTQQGWTGLELIANEVMETARDLNPARADEELMEDEDPDGLMEEESPDLEAARLQGWQPSFLSEWWKAALKSKGMLLALGLILAFGIYRHSTGPIIFGSVGIAFLLLLFPALSLWYSQGSRAYSRLNKAKTWGRWEEVLQCVERLRRLRRWTGTAISELELTRNRAMALAALGRLDDGLREFSRFEGDPALPSWLHASFLAGIHDAALQFERSLEFRRQSAAEKPDTSAVWIDLAYSLVRGLNRPAEAREALARAETLEIPALGKPYPFFLRGIILWREHKPSEAKEQLDHALACFIPLAHHDLVEGTILLTKGYLCAVHGELGDTTRAKALFGEVEKFLIANREHDLLQACRANLKLKR
jgi:tetratricopeptide (TPR) repeat protein